MRHHKKLVIDGANSCGCWHTLYSRLNSVSWEFQHNNGMFTPRYKYCSVQSALIAVYTTTHVRLLSIFTLIFSVWLKLSIISRTISANPPSPSTDTLTWCSPKIYIYNSKHTILLRYLKQRTYFFIVYK